MMEMSKCFLFALLGGFVLAILVHAQDPSGFINIDCGISENSSYTDGMTGLDYISDATLIDSGVIKSVSSEYMISTLPQQFFKLRSFPHGLRNCYTVRLTQAKDTRYLIRASFMYGNYDGQSQVPEFDLHLGPNFWESVKFNGVTYYLSKEIIHVPQLNYIQVCLVNTGLGTPIISAIELRPLKNSTYTTVSGSLVLFTRYDTGATTNQTIRYKDDVYDRIWFPNFFKDWTQISNSLTIDEQNQNIFEPPSLVMSTAATPLNASASLDFNWLPTDPTSKFYIYMHFTEIQELQSNQSRQFNISFNGKHFYGPVVPLYLVPNTVYSQSSLITEAGKYEFSIYKTGNSTLPPIINAIEIYMVNELPQSQTNQNDADAIVNIKSIYGLKRIWQGDPCAPAAYVWEGLNCSYEGYDPPRIISLNLSSSGLTGGIAPHLSDLTSIQILDLSNNNLTGPVPEFLSRLPSLRILNLGGNKLTGSVPAALIERSKNKLLSLSVGGNPDLCESVSCKKEKNKFVLPVVASVTSLSILLIALAILWSLKRRKQHVAKVNIPPKKKNVSPESKNHQFTYSDVIIITNNFERVLGKGGFGTVYHGYIDDTQVAVKMLSPSSAQGYKQFEAEVKLLMRVHHRNLTTLVGYCDEDTNMGLIYEYMAYGNLEEHLSDVNAKILSWEERLRIAMDAAQGLEYLHSGCKPPIIHRDVKSTNILLNEKFQAKLADFGLSRIFPTEGGTHVSTVVAGTPGYLDPEYYISNRLHEKSDVYSFGVLLLEIITCRPVITKAQEKTHISQWVSFMLEKGDIKNTVDPRLHGDFDTNSAWKAVEIAMACVSPASTRRPTMSHVVMELKECLAIEMVRSTGSRENDSPEMFTVKMDTDLTPLAR